MSGLFTLTVHYEARCQCLSLMEREICIVLKCYHSQIRVLKGKRDDTKRVSADNFTAFGQLEDSLIQAPCSCPRQQNLIGLIEDDVWCRLLVYFSYLA